MEKELKYLIRITYTVFHNKNDVKCEKWEKILNGHFTKENM